mmetsp:Transcript_40693/g.63540  ORF Transcript_40693/g.63540 Transcript_40693/m.63540 type:complete len:106 (-) Transcript_40693:244-561(-)
MMLIPIEYTSVRLQWFAGTTGLCPIDTVLDFDWGTCSADLKEQAEEELQRNGLYAGDHRGNLRNARHAKNGNGRGCQTAHETAGKTKPRHETCAKCSSKLLSRKR